MVDFWRKNKSVYKDSQISPGDEFKNMKMEISLLQKKSIKSGPVTTKYLQDSYSKTEHYITSKKKNKLHLKKMPTLFWNVGQTR